MVKYYKKRSVKTWKKKFPTKKRIYKKDILLLKN